MSKKELLSESQIRRFMTLANLEPLAKNVLSEEKHAEKEEKKEEGMYEEAKMKKAKMKKEEMDELDEFAQELENDFGVLTVEDGEEPAGYDDDIEDYNLMDEVENADMLGEEDDLY